jgi:hypothetical protein
MSPEAVPKPKPENAIFDRSRGRVRAVAEPDRLPEIVKTALARRGRWVKYVQIELLTRRGPSRKCRSLRR